ncbi:aldehyde dehydrogenase family protein, partial [Acinetobacter baumannii]
AIGGDAPSADGYYVNPTVLVDVNPQMSVVREEIFGPVAVVTPFDDLDEVVGGANDSPYGLAASVWTEGRSNGHRI